MPGENNACVRLLCFSAAYPLNMSPIRIWPKTFRNSPYPLRSFHFYWYRRNHSVFQSVCQNFTTIYLTKFDIFCKQLPVLDISKFSDTPTATKDQTVIIQFRRALLCQFSEKWRLAWYKKKRIFAAWVAIALHGQNWRNFVSLGNPFIFHLEWNWAPFLTKRDYAEE